MVRVNHVKYQLQIQKIAVSDTSVECVSQCAVAHAHSPPDHDQPMYTCSMHAVRITDLWYMVYT